MTERDYSKQSARPNIVLIMADDLGYCDLGCYGGEILTPNLDRLARNGLRFTHFYNNAVCVASRTALLTGLYPQQLWNPLGHHLQRNENNVTLAEVLRTSGYRTLMSGKWHNGKVTGELPVDRGFDRGWGLLSGGSNYFNPGKPRSGETVPVHKSETDLRPWGDDDKIMFPYTPEDRNFYATDAFTDHALGFLDQYGRETRPFFLYLPYTAPHFPMQAWPEDIVRYEGKYMIGWDETRRQRYRRLLQMGLVDERWGVSDRDGSCPAWESVPNQDRIRWDRKMAVYAAMVDRMDQRIGDVLRKIRSLGKEENTLVIFLSDNGGCSGHIDNTPDKPPGGRDTYTTVDAPWANASNTPFRKFKVFDHEGGISTPMIVSWPKVLGSGGKVTHEVGHVMDFLPTFAELAGIDLPSANGSGILPCEGKSLTPLFFGRGREGHEALFWELYDCRAVRKGKWKLVTMGPARRRRSIEIEPGHENWELYDMETDRCELNDLAGKEPAVVNELDALWRAWFEGCREDSARRS